jgi:hypothetical protein
MYVLHIEKLGTLFSDVHFVHVVRDGRDCAVSYHRRWRYRAIRTIYRRRKVVAEGRRQGAALGDRCLEIVYETVTRESNRTLERVYEFLSVGFEEAVLAARRVRSKVTGSSRSIIIRNSGNYREYFSAQQIRGLEGIAGKMLTTLGYVVENQAEEEPSNLGIKLLTVHDSLRPFPYTYLSEPC